MLQTELQNYYKEKGEGGEGNSASRDRDREGQFQVRIGKKGTNLPYYAGWKSDKVDK